MFFSSLLLFLLISADQLTKHMIRVKGGFYICNPSVALGIQLEPLIFWIVWISIITAIFYLLISQDLGVFAISRFGYVLVLAGAFSNMLDRLIIGCITDFIDLRFWPVFNLADLFITIGVIIVILSLLKKK